ncbi:hypothetical protein [Aeromonas allosaccharophila]|uniref:hypothetical protein n=1 Tax=Aeromonas allosaccharophila TaxID=656 RepID=UPI003007436A
MAIRPQPAARTSIMVYGDTIPMADAVTLHMANKAGRPMTRTEMVNELIHREYAKLATAQLTKEQTQ